MDAPPVCLADACLVVSFTVPWVTRSVRWLRFEGAYSIVVSEGFPMDFFPVLFAVPRVVGWLAHWRQMMLQGGGVKIWRPRQVRGCRGCHAAVPAQLIHQLGVRAGVRRRGEARLRAHREARGGGGPPTDAICCRAWRVSCACSLLLACRSLVLIVRLDLTPFLAALRRGPCLRRSKARASSE